MTTPIRTRVRYTRGELSRAFLRAMWRGGLNRICLVGGPVALAVFVAAIVIGGSWDAVVTLPGPVLPLGLGLLAGFAYLMAHLVRGVHPGEYDLVIDAAGIETGKVDGGTRVRTPWSGFGYAGETEDAVLASGAAGLRVLPHRAFAPEDLARIRGQLSRWVPNATFRGPIERLSTLDAASPARPAGPDVTGGVTVVFQESFGDLFVQRLRARFLTLPVALALGATLPGALLVLLEMLQAPLPPIPQTDLVLFYVFFAPFFFVYLVVFVPVLEALRVRRSPSFGHPEVVTFTSDGLTSRHPGGEASVKWWAVERVIESRSRFEFELKPGAGASFSFAKRGASEDDLAAMRGLLRAHAPLSGRAP